jgi:hypothetical protein
MIFRCTAKARKRLHLVSSDLVETPSRSSGSDWHCNVVTLGRRPFFLLAHSASLFGILLLAAGHSTRESFGEVFRQHALGVLQHEGLDLATIREVLDHGPDRFARATDRRVLGSMVDFANMSHFVIEDEGGVDSDAIAQVHKLINESPMSFLRMESPREALRRLLTSTTTLHNQPLQLTDRLPPLGRSPLRS